MKAAYIIAARRTAVAPRNGAFRAIEAWDLGATVIRAVCADARVEVAAVDEAIFGNALYGGGNPARMAMLAASAPERLPALTVDTQCCAGLDAILLAASRIRAGEADIILAGGLESYSRSPLRLRRPLAPGEATIPYDRPPFAPWPEKDPDPMDAAVALARLRGVSRQAQEAYAAESHRKALAHDPAQDSAEEIAPLAGLTRDDFARRLTPALCARLPLLAGDAAHGVTTATVAVEADAAAAVLVVSEDAAKRLGAETLLWIVVGQRIGVDPGQPTLAAGAAAARLLAREGWPDIAAAEIMEAFAVQAMAAIADAGLDPACVNRGGGALSRGHPIGASGAILAVRLFHELAREAPGAHGLAAIAAVGGLGAAMLCRRA